MRRIITTGLVGLGLVGGAGAVVYDGNGTPTVTIQEANGKKTTTKLDMENGKTYSCPLGIDDKLRPHDEQAGRAKITLKRVRTQEDAFEHRYGKSGAPGNAYARWQRLNARDDRLVHAYNVEIDARNAILDRDCTS